MKKLHDVRKSETQKHAEAEVSSFQDALGPFVTAAEATRMPMMFTDAKQSGRPIVFVNQAFLDLTGYKEHELMGQSFDTLLERHGTDPEMLIELQSAFKGGRDLEATVRYHLEDGTCIWVTINVAPVRNINGEVVQYFASFINITPQKQEEDRLRLLVKELGDKIDKLSGNENAAKPHEL